MKTLVLLVFLVTLCVPSFSSGAENGGWTPAKAAAKVKAAYSAPDPKAMAVIQHNIDQQFASGKTEDDPVIVSLRASLEKTKHAAKVLSARCIGVGKSSAGRFARFHCTAQVAGTARVPPDYEVYRATKRLTVKTRPFKITEGWR